VVEAEEAGCQTLVDQEVLVVVEMELGLLAPQPPNLELKTLEVAVAVAALVLLVTEAQVLLFFVTQVQEPSP
jgi:hypothetical protein